MHSVTNSGGNSRGGSWVMTSSRVELIPRRILVQRENWFSLPYRLTRYPRFFPENSQTQHLKTPFIRLTDNFFLWWSHFGQEYNNSLLCMAEQPRTSSSICFSFTSEPSLCNNITIRSVIYPGAGISKSSIFYYKSGFIVN